jgi:hypothetical protein
MGDIEDIDMEFWKDKYVIFTISNSGDIVILGYRITEEAANDYIWEYIQEGHSNVAYVLGEDFKDVSSALQEGIMNE